jgi:hypothetical protein
MVTSPGEGRGLAHLTRSPRGSLRGRRRTQRQFLRCRRESVLATERSPGTTSQRPQDAGLRGRVARFTRGGPTDSTASPVGRGVGKVVSDRPRAQRSIRLRAARIPPDLLGARIPAATSRLRSARVRRSPSWRVPALVLGSSVRLRRLAEVGRCCKICGVQFGPWPRPRGRVCRVPAGGKSRYLRCPIWR